MTTTSPSTVLITGSTDGIGREAARLLAVQGHEVILHGRNPHKLAAVQAQLGEAAGRAIEGHVADLADMAAVEALARAVSSRHERISVLINNAGVYNPAVATTPAGLGSHFAVNTIAPYLLTQRLLPRMSAGGRVVNLSSAAQAPVDLRALLGRRLLSDGAAYAQSKLALTMWSRGLAARLGAAGPAVIAVNPGSMLGTKMVKQAFGVRGGDVLIGARVLVAAALSNDFAHASGEYFDNDLGRFSRAHPDTYDDGKVQAVIRAVEEALARVA